MFLRPFIIPLLVSCCALLQLNAGNLDGASGRLFKPDLENRSFEFLTETEYDPKTDIGQSRFTVHWAEDAAIEGNGFSVIHGVANAELWLGNYQEEGFHWDVILFNHGLHDLKQSYDKASDTFGDYAVSLEDYKANLEKLIGILKKTGATLVWTSTTPIPNDNKSQYARRKGAAKVFNQAAMEVMQRHPEIIINDLYAVVDESPLYDEWRKGTDVHFYKEEERELLGETVASAVREALAKCAEKADDEPWLGGAARLARAK